METNETKVSFTTSIKDVLRLFGTDGMLYSRDHDVFLREFIQNSMDAIALYMADEIKSGRNNRNFEGQISISYVKGPEANKIIIEDNGRGMNENWLKNQLLHPLKGLYFLLQKEDVDNKGEFIGYFGVGLLSAFKISDLIEVESKRNTFESRKLTIRIEKSGDGDIEPNAFLTPFNKETHGTRIIIHLKSNDREVNQRIKMIDSSPKILEALRYYIRHPGQERIFFTDETGRRIEIDNVPYQGSDMESRREINIPGIRGYIAYRGKLDQCRFQVCQMGILVNENYLSLLPNDSTSLIGEINLKTTSKVNLSISREKIIENEKFKKLKENISTEIGEFMKKEFATWEREQDTVSITTEHEEVKNKMHQESSDAFDLSIKMNNNQHPEIIRRRIFKEISFYVESEDKYMLIEQIEALCRQREQKKVYLYSFNINKCCPVLSLKGTTLFVPDLSHEVYVDLLKKNQQIVIRIAEKNRDNPDKYSFRKLIRERLEEKGIRVADVFSIEDELTEEELPGSPEKKAKLVNIESAKDKTVYRINGWNSYEKILINAKNEDIKQVLINFNNISGDEKKKSIYQAYMNILCGNFDESLDLLKQLLS